MCGGRAIPFAFGLAVNVAHIFEFSIDENHQLAFCCSSRGQYVSGFARLRSFADYAATRPCYDSVGSQLLTGQVRWFLHTLSAGTADGAAQLSSERAHCEVTFLPGGAEDGVRDRIRVEMAVSLSHFMQIRRLLELKLGTGVPVDVGFSLQDSNQRTQPSFQEFIDGAHLAFDEVSFELWTRRTGDEEFFEKRRVENHQEKLDSCMQWMLGLLIAGVASLVLKTFF